MQVKVKGLVIDKITNVNKDTGVIKKSLRLYTGDKVNTDLVVGDPTFEKNKVGVQIEVEANIGNWEHNGKSGIWAKEIEKF